MILSIWKRYIDKNGEKNSGEAFRRGTGDRTVSSPHMRLVFFVHAPYLENSALPPLLLPSLFHPPPTKSIKAIHIQPLDAANEVTACESRWASPPPAPWIFFVRFCFSSHFSCCMLAPWSVLVLTPTSALRPSPVANQRNAKSRHRQELACRSRVRNVHPVYEILFPCTHLFII